MFIIETKSPKPVPIQDLGISVSRAKPETITFEQKTKSICLANLIKNGSVQVSPISRSREEKAPPAPQKKPRKDLPPELAGRSPKAPQGSGKILQKAPEPPKAVPATPASATGAEAPEAPQKGRGGRRKKEVQP